MAWNDARQKLPRLADERLPLQVFVPSRRLADKDDSRMRIADPEHQVGPRPAELAAAALPQLTPDLLQCFPCASGSRFNSVV